jgi:putative redox protein
MAPFAQRDGMEIRVSFPGGKRVDAELEGTGFVVRTDQSAEHGGNGSAPEPYQLFLASIAACVGSAVLSFFRARSLPTEGLELVQRNEYDATGKRLTKVKLSITVPAGFAARYRPVLVRAANLCSVKRAISDPPEFEVTVTGG